MLNAGDLAVVSVLGQLRSVPLEGTADKLRGCWVTIIGYGQQGVSRTFLADFPAAGFEVSPQRHRQ